MTTALVTRPVMSVRGGAAALLALTKPRVTALVLATCAAGAWLAPGDHAPGLLVRILGGTWLTIASANVLNMFIERDLDARMERTKDRPLPSGRLSPQVALVFGLICAVFGLAVLFGINVVTGLLGAIALGVYVGIYTPLKQKTWLALLVGAVPGAFPPAMGWSGVTGALERPALVLFSLVVVWQLVHFTAIAIFRSSEYARAGMKVISVELGEARARSALAAFAMLFVATTFALPALGLGGVVYLLVAGCAGALLMWIVFLGTPRRVFLASNAHLCVLLIALLSRR